MFVNFGRSYVYRYVTRVGNKQQRIWLADEVSPITIGKYFNDHWNGDTLDNQKDNLRPATMGENSCNRKKYSNNGSKYKGVEPVGKRWRAKITHNKIFTSLGYFDTEIEAARAYNDTAIRLHGEFASINDLDKEKNPEGMKEI